MGRTIECYGCYQRFKTFSHMILHLEDRGCVSEITTQDLYTTATRCYQSHKYIDRDYWADMLGGEDLEEVYIDTVLPFLCLQGDSAFSKLSGLLQHASSHTCKQTLQMGAIGKLLKWLDNQYRWDSVLAFLASAPLFLCADFREVYFLTYGIPSATRPGQTFSNYSHRLSTSFSDLERCQPLHPHHPLIHPLYCDYYMYRTWLNECSSCCYAVLSGVCNRLLQG